LASARAACSAQGRCLSTYPGWAPSRVLCSGRLSQTVARQPVEGAGLALRVSRILSHSFARPIPAQVEPKVAPHPCGRFRIAQSSICIIAADRFVHWRPRAGKPSERERQSDCQPTALPDHGYQIISKAVRGLHRCFAARRRTTDTMVSSAPNHRTTCPRNSATWVFQGYR
jgi:hypothetical protein